MAWMSARTNGFGVGRSTTSGISGRRSGRLGASLANPANACSSTRTRCWARDGFLMQHSTTPKICSNTGAPTILPTPSCSGARTKSGARFHMRTCTRSSRAVPKRLLRMASALATGWRRSCPTCRKRSSPCSPRHRAARSGRRVHPISACKACSTVSGRSSRACCLPSMAIGTTASRCRSSTRSAILWRGYRRSSGWSWFRTCSAAPVPLMICR